MMRTILRYFFIILLSLVAVWFWTAAVSFLYSAFVKAPPSEWGLTFVPKASEEVGVPWERSYLAILDELKPRTVRLAAPWDEIEPKESEWDFSKLDWQVAQANQRQIKYIIALGQKTPGWPECHFPDWVEPRAQSKDAALFRYEEAVITHFKDQPNLLYWQVENEPLVRFGECPPWREDLLAEEVKLARSLDAHPILVTDGERVSLWQKAGKYGDVTGVALYRQMDFRGKTFTLPEIPSFFTLKRKLTRLLNRHETKPFIIIEVGLEPWNAPFTFEDFTKTRDFAEKTKFGTYYAWGAEWWYSQKLQGNDRYWEEAKKLFQP